jgi:hypothetical protein
VGKSQERGRAIGELRSGAGAFRGQAYAYVVVHVL